MDAISLEISLEGLKWILDMMWKRLASKSEAIFMRLVKQRRQHIKNVPCKSLPTGRESFDIFTCQTVLQFCIIMAAKWVAYHMTALAVMTWYGLGWSSRVSLTTGNYMRFILSILNATVGTNAIYEDHGIKSYGWCPDWSSIGSLRH